MEYVNWLLVLWTLVGYHPWEVLPKNGDQEQIEVWIFIFLASYLWNVSSLAESF